MESNKALSALCYFSIFFAGFLLPLIVFFVSSDPEVKKHAKSSFLSHIIPLAAVPFMLAALIFDQQAFQPDGGFPVFIIVSLIVSFILTVSVVVWNVYKGIKVLI
ncbi:DUF4870 domain-containing protein [Falsibacillus pallidus]|uniref:Uncharacterized protein DUF4870 n=1 Tax=Falsibacillus pallidus TaxID=493781 RepID=A0A370GBF9_9BACI|nr:DUF4870 domain-containing protein [Falsibacillus pallidus]RDI41037.1 uncharacterized protein DUF4870 [Falsibacillus pallidus]